MPQELVLFLRQFEKPHAQPLELSAEPLEVRRSLDANRPGESTFAELVDGAVDLRDRSRDE